MKVNADNVLVYSFEDVLNVIMEMSHCQGFYNRLLESIYDLMENDPDKFDAFVEQIEAEEFRSPVQVVLYFEA